MMKKTYILNDKEFVCVITPVFSTCVEVTVKTARRTFGHKCLRTIGSGNFNPNAFGSIDAGVLKVINKVLEDKEREERAIKKWKEFEKTLDKPYII